MRYSIPSRAALRLGAALVALLLGGGAVGGPVGEQVVHGAASFQRDGGLTTIHAADRTIIHYRSFDVASREAVQFIQPGATARVLNRIASAAPTQIDGALRANGIVYLVNPAGVRFGQGAVVDVGQIYAAAGSISNRDFLDGVNRFTGLQGDVLNWGTIQGDVVGLVGRHVGNYGSILAESGVVAMVAGDEVTLTRLGSQMLVKVSGGGGEERPGVENAGEVSAPHGSVMLGAGDLYSLAVKNVGMVKAKSVVVQGRAAEGSGALEAEELTLSGTALADDMALSVEEGRIAIGLNGATLRASVSDRLIVRAGGGDDSLTVNLSGGNPIPAGGLLYDGQDNDTAAGDSLVLTGAAASVGYLFTGPTSGAITLDGSLIIYTGLEPIVDTVVGANLTINATAGANAIAITDGPGSGGFTTCLVQIDAFESIEFANKTTVAINGEGDNDIFTLNHPNPADGLTTLQLNGGLGEDQFNVTAFGGGPTLVIQGNGGGDTATVTQAGTLGTPLAGATFTVETVNLQGPVYAGALGGSPPQVNVQNNTARIQDGLDLVGAGGTVTVGDGIFTEDLTVATANVTLESANGSGSTTLQHQAGVGLDVQGTADGFTFGGGPTDGFTVLSGPTTTFLVQLTNGPSDATVSNNAFDTSGNASMGISVGVAGTSGLTITDNTFTTADAGDGFIWGPHVVDATVTGNTFTGPSATPASGYAVQFSGLTVSGLPQSTISGNTIDDVANGILLSNGPGTSNVLIDNNAITACTNGIRFAQYSPGASGNLTNVTITNNTLTDCTRGVRIGDGANIVASALTIENNVFDGNDVGLRHEHTSQGLTVTDNDFVGNTTFAIQNTGSAALDARLNYFGSANGPTHANNTYSVGSQGDAVSDNVGFVPWIHASFSGPNSPVTPVRNVTQGTDHASFQTAIDGASNGDLIESIGGTFTENFAVTEMNLTIRPQDGSGGTTIQLQTGIGIDIPSSGSGLTFGGDPDDRYGILSGAGTSTQVRLNGPSGVTISDVDIDSTGNASVGIDILGGAGAFTIADSTIQTADASDTGIRGVSITDVTISGNDFTGPSGGSTGIDLSGVTAPTLPASTLSGNTFTDLATGLRVAPGTGTSDLDIDNNQFDGCDVGIDILSTGAGTLTFAGLTNNTFDTNGIGLRINDGPEIQPSTFTIENNTFTDNTVGFRFAHTTEGVTVSQSDFEGNTTFAVESTGGQVVDARSNWWDSTAGPRHASNPGPPGLQGDPVSDDVLFIPWLNAPFGSGGVVSPVINITQGTVHATIQLGIDNAADGDALLAIDGTYTEDLTVNVPNLTLQSQNGSGSATLQLVDGVGIDIPNTGSGLTFGGTGVGFEVLGGATTTFLVSLNGGPTDVTIADSTFNTSGSASVGVDIDNSGTSGFTFTDCTITVPDVTDTGIRGGPIVDLQITDSTFTGPGALPAPGSTGIDLDGVTASGLPASTISGTTTISNFDTGIAVATGTGTASFTFDSLDISGCNTGIDLMSGGAGTFTLTTITNTTLNANGTGIRVRDGADLQPDTFTFQSLTVTGNATGILHEHTTDTLAVSQSDFTGNTTAVSAPGAAVIAENNWWASANGPTHASNTFNVGSQGQPVTGTIDFTPWLDAPVATGNPFAPVTNVTQTTYHPSIQDGIDNAVAGDRLRAVDGVFTEDLVVDVSNLTIESATGRANTTIQFVNGTGVGIDVQANGFLLGGGSGSGFTLLGSGTTNTLVQFAGSRTLTEIAHNAFDTSGNATVAINLGTGADEVYVNDNTFTLADVGDSGVVGSAIADLEVRLNTFTGSGPMAASGAAVLVDGVTGAGMLPRIDGNTISNFAAGIRVAAGTGTTSLDLINNDVSGCTAGIDLRNTGVAAFTFATISGNDITGNTAGILIANGPNIRPSTFTIEFNNISGNTTGLASAHATQTTDASLNWWGDPTGPVHASNLQPAPAGDLVVGAVTVLPYLATATVTPANIRVSVIDDFGGAGETLLAWSDTITGAITAAIPNSSNAITPTFGGPSGGHGARTYTETAVLNKAGLTLRSDPLDTITLRPTGATAASIEANACTVGGAPGQGFTINSTLGAATLIDFVGAPSGATISDNTLNTASAATVGIDLGAGGADGATIRDNTFRGQAGDTAIAGTNASNLAVTMNTFTGPGVGLDLAGTNTALIQGNTFTNLDAGLVIANGGGSDQVTIDLNTFDTCGTGILFTPSTAGPLGDLTNAVATRNLFDGCGTGVQIDNSARLPAGSFLIQGNAFTNSTAWALDSQAAGVLDCSGNWWDTAAPTQVPNQFSSAPNGIDYSPWLRSGANGAAGPGFEGNFAGLHISLASPQAAAVSALQEGHDFVTAGGTVVVEPGTYNTGLVTTKAFTGQLVGPTVIDAPVILGSAVRLIGTSDLTFNHAIVGAADGVGGLICDLGGGNATFTDHAGRDMGLGQRLGHFQVLTTGDIALNTTAGNDTFTIHVRDQDVVLGSDLPDVPQVATIWSEGPGGGSLDIQSAFGSVAFGEFHKVTVAGDPAADPLAGGLLSISAPNGTITGTDFSARRITFVSSGNRFYRRADSFVLNARGNLELDYGPDVVGLLGVTLVGGNSRIGSGNVTTVAANDPATVLGANGLLVGTLPTDKEQPFVADLLPGRPVLDLQADPGARELATVFASVIPRVEDIEIEPEEVELSPAMIELLEQIGIFARKARPGEANLFDDLIAKPPSEQRPEDHRVAASRLDPELVERAVAAYRAVYWKDGKYQAAAIKDTLRKALDHCRKLHKDEQAFDPAAFRRCLETEAACREALRIVNEFRTLFGYLNVLGLSPIEVRISERILVRDIVSRGLTGQQIIDTIQARTAASRPAAP